MRSHRPHVLSGLALLALLTGCRGIAAIDEPPPLGDAAAEARVTLGQTLFFDPRLSAGGDVSCGTCHRPDHGGAEPLAVSEGTGGALGRRNAPSVLNAAFKSRQFWDGRVDALEEQALGPLFSDVEMGSDPETLVATLEREGYAVMFAAAFPDRADPITPAAVGEALAAYERRLTWPGRVDRFLDGDRSALSDEEQAGMRFFNGNCAFCHDGPGVGGLRMERLGAQVPWPEERSQDLGRQEVTGRPGDRLRFVVPSLRHVGETAPYFHDGSVATLEEAVVLMGRHQLGQELTDDRVRQVASFLRALDGDIPAELLAAPQLP